MQIINEENREAGVGTWMSTYLPNDKEGGTHFNNGMRFFNMGHAQGFRHYESSAVDGVLHPTVIT